MNQNRTSPADFIKNKIESGRFLVRQLQFVKKQIDIDRFQVRQVGFIKNRVSVRLQLKQIKSRRFRTKRLIQVESTQNTQNQIPTRLQYRLSQTDFTQSTSRQIDTR